MGTFTSNEATLSNEDNTHKIAYLTIIIDSSSNVACDCSDCKCNTWKSAMANQKPSYGRFKLKWLSKKVSIDKDYQLKLASGNNIFIANVTVVSKKGIFSKEYTYIINGKLIEEEKTGE